VPERRGPDRVTLRVASVNLFSGRSVRDGRIDHDRVSTGIAELDADVLALQEVDRGQPRSGGADQTELVATAAGAAERRFLPLVAGAPGEPGWQGVTDGAAPAGPSYGIALVSRREVTAWHELRMAPPRGRFPLLIPSRPPRLLWTEEEPRGALAAVLTRPHLVVGCTHLSFVPGVNIGQLRRVRAWLAGIAEAADAPLVLLGDLNLPGGLPGRLTGWTPLVRGASYPSPAPRVQIDHVLAHGLDPAVAGAATGHGRVVPLPFSDHRALVTELAEEPADFS
jgi:endonuclease/exonuclease/phosphatase family metal-dependent hydrolase